MSDVEDEVTWFGVPGGAGPVLEGAGRGGGGDGGFFAWVGGDPSPSGQPSGWAGDGGVGFAGIDLNGFGAGAVAGVAETDGDAGGGGVGGEVVPGGVTKAVTEGEQRGAVGGIV